MLVEGVGERSRASVLYEPASCPFITRATVGSTLLVPLLVASVCYQALLCFANTSFVTISPGLVAAAEAALYAVCGAMLTARLRMQAIILIALSFGYLLVLSLIRGGLDLKSFRDLLIPVLFVWLGAAYGSRATGDRVLAWVVAVVILMGLVEFFFLESYIKVMDIYGYYINQGNLPPGSQWVEGSVLALNGMRTEEAGRTLLPGLLGTHRVSSVFLEPVSLGNFAVVVAAWALAKPPEELRRAILFFSAAAVMVILSDSRYGMGALVFLLLIRVMMSQPIQVLSAIFPALCILLLVVFALLKGNAGEDNLSGRLAISGFALMNMGPATLLGLEANLQAYADMGYAYALSRFGAPLFIALWAVLWLLPVSTPAGERYRSLASLHIAMILCISGTSLFALKTAAVLWFLLGCLLVPFAQRAASTVQTSRSNATA